MSPIAIAFTFLIDGLAALSAFSVTWNLAAIFVSVSPLTTV